MTNRTVQFYGQGYSTPPAEGLALTPCTITATVDGNQVFSGTIPTLETSDIYHLPSEQVLLFSFEIPLVTGGNTASPSTNYTLPVSLDITGDDVFLEQINSNYNSIWDGNAYVSSGATGFDSIYSAGDARSNVVVTGASYVNPPPTEPRDPANTGAWGWEVETASGQTATMTFNMVVSPGLE